MLLGMDNRFGRLLFVLGFELVLVFRLWRVVLVLVFVLGIGMGAGVGIGMGIGP